ncbi:zinc finger Y-chromosomal protein 2-like [Bombyx mandarina]|uniref:Zinc finger Y-chromosomal protein 2-like n=1 Tax=Bombyx mandarina TaxID=7092 RepID=A0A6J2JTF2_BOMMA|nr:zinc finger Y-chromosomal protein 2-like [Bombyx mandarina]
MVNIEVVDPRESRKKKCIIITSRKAELRRKKKYIKITPQDDERDAVNVKLRRVTEIQKLVEAIRVILLCSNATPIRKYGSIGYQCNFCDKEHDDPRDLKVHTLSTHKEADKLKFLQKHRGINTLKVKLDATCLRCELCDTPSDDVEQLIDHLTLKHDKSFPSNLKNFIVPFKFETSQTICALCRTEFSNFKILLQHMNVHYRNHVCETCGNGFVNKRILQCHMYRHRTGEFSCSYCAKVFDTRIKQRDHERAIHICDNKRSKCGYCGEKFNDYTKKNEHEIKVHGAKPIVLKCSACEKTFDNQRSLSSHTKRYHLMERPLPKKAD